jgi:hypothetical protein
VDIKTQTDNFIKWGQTLQTFTAYCMNMDWLCALFKQMAENKTKTSNVQKCASKIP